MSTASIKELISSIEVFQSAAAEDPTLEAKYGKKIASAMKLIEVNVGLIKDLKQAYGNAEKKWALNCANDADGCTKLNKAEKIKQYIMVSPAYVRHFSNPKSRGKVEEWLADKFENATAATSVDQAA